MERIFDEFVDVESPNLFPEILGPIARWLFETNELNRLWREQCRRRGWPDPRTQPVPQFVADEWSKVISATFTSRCHHVGHTTNLLNARTRTELWDACDRIANQADGRRLSEEQLRDAEAECHRAICRLNVGVDNSTWYRLLREKCGRDFVATVADYLRQGENSFEWVRPERLRHHATEIEKVAIHFPAYLARCGQRPRRPPRIAPRRIGPQRARSVTRHRHRYPNSAAQFGANA